MRCASFELSAEARSVPRKPFGAAGERGAGSAFSRIFRAPPGRQATQLLPRLLFYESCLFVAAADFAQAQRRFSRKKINFRQRKKKSPSSLQNSSWQERPSQGRQTLRRKAPEALLGARFAHNLKLEEAKRVFFSAASAPGVSRARFAQRASLSNFAQSSLRR